MFNQGRVIRKMAFLRHTIKQDNLYGCSEINGICQGHFGSV